MATRGRPRKPITGDADIHVAVMLPPWVVEAIDSEGEPRGAFVARLFMERLAGYHPATELARKIDEVLYG